VECIHNIVVGYLQEISIPVSNVGGFSQLQSTLTRCIHFSRQ